MEEQILKIITSDGAKLADNGTVELWYPDECAKEITDHVMEFIEWLTSTCIGTHPETWMFNSDKESYLFTDYEAYNYWLTNIKK